MAVADGTILRIVASLLFPENVIAQNIFYAVFTDTGTSDDEQDVVDDLATYIEAIYDLADSNISDEITLTGVKVYEYDSGDDDWDEVGDAVINHTFGSANDMSAHGVSVVLHAKTTDPDVQAAKYFGGWTEQMIIDGLFISAMTALVLSMGAEWTAPFVGAITGADFGPGVWSPTETNFFLFSGTEVFNLIPGYQRRRKPGVGI